MKKPTKKRRSATVEYIRHVKSRLDLEDWIGDIRFHHKQEDGDPIAQVSMTPGRLCASIEIYPAFFAEDPYEQRHVVVHELTHMLMSRTLTLIEDSMPNISGISKDAADAVAVMFGATQEYEVDAVARLLAPTIPLPDIP